MQSKTTYIVEFSDGFWENMYSKYEYCLIDRVEVGQKQKSSRRITKLFIELTMRARFEGHNSSIEMSEDARICCGPALLFRIPYNTA